MSFNIKQSSYIIGTKTQSVNKSNIKNKESAESMYIHLNVIDFNSWSVHVNENESHNMTWHCLHWKTIGPEMSFSVSILFFIVWGRIPCSFKEIETKVQISWKRKNWNSENHDYFTLYSKKLSDFRDYQCVLNFSFLLIEIIMIINEISQSFLKSFSVLCISQYTNSYFQVEIRRCLRTSALFPIVNEITHYCIVLYWLKKNYTWQSLLLQKSTAGLRRTPWTSPRTYAIENEIPNLIYSSLSCRSFSVSLFVQILDRTRMSQCSDSLPRTSPMLSPRCTPFRAIMNLLHYSILSLPLRNWIPMSLVRLKSISYALQSWVWFNSRSMSSWFIMVLLKLSTLRTISPTSWPTCPPSTAMTTRSVFLPLLLSIKCKSIVLEHLKIWYFFHFTLHFE